MTDTATARAWTLSRVMKWIAIAFCALLLAVALVAAGFHWWMSGGTFSVSRFEPEVWFKPATRETESDCYRGYMASDIQERLLKRGMTYQDVENLLGKPDGPKRPNQYDYILGMCSGFRMDYDSLVVYFDADGRYERSMIVQH